MKSGTRFMSDIISAVAKKNGLSQKDVQEVWDHQKRIVPILMDDEETTRIKIPFVGRLVMSTYLYTKAPARINQNVGKKCREIMSDPTYTDMTSRHYQRPNFMKLFRWVNKYYNTGYTPRLYANPTKCFNTIQQFSNGALEHLKRETPWVKPPKTLNNDNRPNKEGSDSQDQE
jgi:hypothetical protein